MKALNSERKNEAHHKSPLTKTMTDNQHNSRKDDRELKATERPIAITNKDNKKYFEKDNKNHDFKDLKDNFQRKERQQSY